MLKKVLIGLGIAVGGLFALFVGLVIIVLVVGGNRETNRPSPPAAQSEKTTEKPKSSSVGPIDVEVGQGETAELRDRTLSVEEVERNYFPPNPRVSYPKQGNELVRVYLVLKNTGNQSFDYNPNNFKVQDSQGVQNKHKTISQMPYSNIGTGGLASGGTVESNLVFEVPQGDPTLTLIYEPFEKRSVETASIDLT